MRGKDLDGDYAVEACVAGFVNLPHPAYAEERDCDNQESYQANCFLRLLAR